MVHFFKLSDLTTEIVHFNFFSSQWRRNPVPARFLGVQDHIIVRDIAEHKIFLNMSTSEVLCTTSAEALAMGKFVILPRHCTFVLYYEVLYRYLVIVSHAYLYSCSTTNAYRLQYILLTIPKLFVVR